MTGSYDQAQSSRLGQKQPPENPGVQICTFSTLPEVAYKGQIVYLTDLNEILVYDGTAWQEITGGGGITVTGNRIFVQTADPTISEVVNPGDLWFNTASQILKTWDGSAWVDQKIANGAADGITITGSIFQTAASGSRMVIQDSGGYGTITWETGVSGVDGQVRQELTGGTTPFMRIFPSTTTAKPTHPEIQLQPNSLNGFISVQGDTTFSGGTVRLSTQPYVYRYRTSNQSIPDSNVTDVTFGTGSSGDIGITNTSDTVFTVPANGVYSIVGSLGWASGSSTGRRTAHIMINGSSQYVSTLDASALNATNASQQVHGVAKLSAGDTVKLSAYQTSGSSVNVEGDQNRTHLTIYMMG